MAMVLTQDGQLVGFLALQELGRLFEHLIVSLGPFRSPNPLQDLAGGFTGLRKVDQVEPGDEFGNVGVDFEGKTLVSRGRCCWRCWSWRRISRHLDVQGVRWWRSWVWAGLEEEGGKLLSSIRFDWRPQRRDSDWDVDEINSEDRMRLT